MLKQLQEKAIVAGANIPFQEIRSTTDKRARIEVLQPMVKNGAIQFSKRHIMLLEQMKCFPKGAHDDGLDALEMAIKLSQEYDRGEIEVWGSSTDRIAFTEYGDDFYDDNDDGHSSNAREIKWL